jgi:hypothetical protein
MCCPDAAGDHDVDMLGRTSLPLVGALPTTNDGRPASIGVARTFGGSWFAVSPAGAKVDPRSQPQSGGGYGGGY